MPTPEEFIAEIREHHSAGRKMEAIRMVRHLTGKRLIECKELVDSNLDSLKPEDFDEIPPMPEAKGCGTTAALLLFSSLIGITYYALA